MADVEFKLTGNALAVVKDATLDANFDECAAALREMMAPYANLVVSEDGVSAAKADRAKIRKIASRIDDTRKEVKRAYSEPLKAFEDRCKELTGICATAADNLDGQVKAYEAQQKAAKIAEIKAHYDEKATDDIKAFLPWESVLNPKWENVGVTMDRAKLDIDVAIENCEKEIFTIRSMGSPFEAALLDCYRETHDLGSVIRKEQTLKQIEESRKALEAEKARREAQIAAETAKAKTESNVVSIETYAKPEAPFTYTVRFAVNGTKEQLTALREFMRMNGLRYSRLD